MKRPILIALLGYIIGIIWGLYLKISIVFLHIITVIIIYLLLQIINKTYNKMSIRLKNSARIIKTILVSKDTKKVLIIIFIATLISSTIIKYYNKQYETKYKNTGKAIYTATVLEEKKEKKYYLQYKIQIEKVNNKNVKQYKLLLRIKNKKQKLGIGSKIQFEGEYSKPQEQRNTGGFNYQLYLKTRRNIWNSYY